MLWLPRWVRGAGEEVGALQELLTALGDQVDRETLEHGQIQVGGGSVYAEIWRFII